MAYTIDNFDLAQLFSNKNNHIIFPKDKGFQKDKIHKIDKDITIIKGFTCTKDNLSIRYMGDSNSLYLFYVLDGQIEFKSKDTKEPLLLNQNKSLIIYTKEKYSSLKFEKDNNSQILGIKIAQDFLDIYLPNFVNNKIEYVSNNPKILPLVKSIYKSSLENELERLYIHSKILKLIHLKFLKFSSLEIEQKIMLSNYDIKALESAKIILENELINVPSIDELSKRVRLNDFKLKNGFKSLFGITPYKFSLENRMKEAKRLLESGKFNVNEASKAVGFPYVQNFTTAFTRKFGVRPIDILKQNQTYIWLNF